MTAPALSLNARAARVLRAGARDQAEWARFCRIVGLTDNTGRLLPDDTRDYELAMIETMGGAPRGVSTAELSVTARPKESTAPDALRNLPPAPKKPREPKPRKPRGHGLGRGRKPDHEYVHGTPAGYKRHKTRGETPCEACVEAKRAEWRRDKQVRDGRPATGKPQRRQVQCGETGGYKRHRRLGEPICEPCTLARREYERLHRAGVRKREPRGELAPCGTVAAARRHRRNGEKPRDVCEPCAQAERAKWRKDVR